MDGAESCVGHILLVGNDSIILVILLFLKPQVEVGYLRISGRIYDIDWFSIVPVERDIRVYEDIGCGSLQIWVVNGVIRRLCFL